MLGVVVTREVGGQVPRRPQQAHEEGAPPEAEPLLEGRLQDTPPADLFADAADDCDEHRAEHQRQRQVQRQKRERLRTKAQRRRHAVDAGDRAPIGGEHKRLALPRSKAGHREHRGVQESRRETDHHPHRYPAPGDPPRGPPGGGPTARSRQQRPQRWRPHRQTQPHHPSRLQPDTDSHQLQRHADGKGHEQKPPQLGPRNPDRNLCRRVGGGFCANHGVASYLVMHGLFPFSTDAAVKMMLKFKGMRDASCRMRQASAPPRERSPATKLRRRQS